MPEMEIKVGDRTFVVACEPGEQKHLIAAAELLDQEASVLRESMGRVPESRMLLMAGLMLSDKTIALGWQMEALEERARNLQQKLEAAEARHAAALAATGGNTTVSSAIDGNVARNLLEVVATEMERLAEAIETRAA